MKVSRFLSELNGTNDGKAAQDASPNGGAIVIVSATREKRREELVAGAELSRDFVHFEREASFLREYCGFVHPNLAQEAMPWANYDYALKSLL